MPKPSTATTLQLSLRSTIARGPHGKGNLYRVEYFLILLSLTKSGSKYIALYLYL